MPAYCFKCECGQRTEAFRSVANRNRAPKCRACRKTMARDLRSEHGGFRNTPGNWPMESDAAGVDVSQVDEAARKMAAAGVPTEFNRDTGAAIFTSRSHRKAACRAMGLYDRNAGYSDPERTGAFKDQAQGADYEYE